MIKPQNINLEELKDKIIIIRDRSGTILDNAFYIQDVNHILADKLNEIEKEIDKRIGYITVKFPFDSEIKTDELNNVKEIIKKSFTNFRGKNHDRKRNMPCL